MTKTQQTKFVRDLSKTVADSIITQIKTGKIPDSWDGHELRVLLEEKHGESAGMSAIRLEGRSKRAMAYRNTVLVNNL
jgi:hypothetical protein